MPNKKIKDPYLPIKPKEITGPVSVYIKNSKQIKLDMPIKKKQ